MTLLDRRLVIVTGKGGVGKTTVAAALGMLGARTGRRTIVAELAGQTRLQRTFGVPPEEPFVEAPLAPGLWAISIDPQLSMEEYLRLKAGAVGGLLSSSRLFGAFAMATPGMRELLSIGKVWELAQDQRRTVGAEPYDLVVLDAPATGHGVGFLRTPRMFADIARIGPIAHQGRQIAATIADRSLTGIVAVTTPEEMPVNETISLREALRGEGLGLELTVLNALYPERFATEDVTALRDAAAPLASTDRGVLAPAAIRAAISQASRARAQNIQAERLRESVAGPVAVLPYLFCPSLGLAEIERLGDTLAGAL